MTLDCDLLAVSGGWNPNVQLFAQGSGRLRFDPVSPRSCLTESDAAVACAGAANGTFRCPRALPRARRPGHGKPLCAALACRVCGRARYYRVTRTNPAAAAPPIPHALSAGERRRAFVDLHNDVTAADIALAAQEGYAVPSI